MKLGRLLALFLCLLAVAACGKRAGTSGRNVILIGIDCLRADHVGAYGYPKPTTPALDAFAAGGVRFANSYAGSSWTLPSHTSMFTGLHEDVHRAWLPQCSIDTDNVMLAEVLQRAGRDTHAIVCAPFLRSAYRIARGFVEFDESIALTRRPEIRHVETSRRVTDKALAYLKKREKAAQPFFLFVHYWDVHYDYIPPKKYADLFDPDYRGKIDANDYSHRRDIGPGMNPRDLQHLVALYDGEVRYVDDHLGELFAWLKASRLAPNTAVIITADHGEEFLEHASTGHNFTCYEESTRVPLVVQAPWIKPQARTINTIVENVDLFPTILSLAGVKPPPGRINGEDLVPLLEHGTPPRRYLFYCETRMGRHYGWQGASGIWNSMRDEAGMKILVFRGHGERQVELYNLATDPGERTNLADSQPEVREKLERQLNQLRAAHSRLARERGLDFQEPTDELINQDINDQLKSLGYVQN